MDITQIVRHYENKIRDKVPLGLRLKSEDGDYGVINKDFLIFLSNDQQLFKEFLCACGLIKNDMMCEKCNSPMVLVKGSNVSDGFIWRCRKMQRNSRGLRCGFKRSIRQASLFSHSRLTMPEIMLLTCEILNGLTNQQIQREYYFGNHTVMGWRQFVQEVIVEYIELNSVKVGGIGKVVEVDESKFAKRKYNRGNFVEGQWVFGGIERESGISFLVAVSDSSEETLIGLIEEWIEPGTRVITDSWKGYDNLSQHWIQHLNINHKLKFVIEGKDIGTNIDKTTWKQVKSSVPTYVRHRRFLTYFAEYMFRKKILYNGENITAKFIQIISSIDWSRK